MENKQIAPHIGTLLKEYSKAKRIYKAAWARHQQVNNKTVLGYFHKPSIQTTTLWNICNVLHYNFFADLANMLPQEYAHAPNSTDEKLAALEKENEKLKIENAVLREVKR